MTTPSPKSDSTPPTATMSRRTDRAADAVWRLLCQGESAPWLEMIRTLRVEQDSFEATMDIWAVALTAELKDPAHREVASRVLARLRRLSEELEETA
ncbi:MAG: hypothetical protein ACYTGC_06090 [Planctomycetota bacterium]